MKFCILIPTINRKDLLMEALEHYKYDYPNTTILILDNGNQGIEPSITKNYIVRTLSELGNLGVAGSWNYLIKEAIDFFNYDYFLVLNDDIILKCGESAINGLIEKWGENTFHIPRPFYNWSAFITNKWIFDKVGEFDENFKRCFFEDNDYNYRLKLAGVNIRYSDELNAEIYRNSQTTLKEPLLGGYTENRDYYIKKWGGLPDLELYKTPFNHEI
jgi:GT2 family glycosyltransferase